ncbi:hypothetical protein COCCADRAFT_88607 [Bipolaris zeicola 26-R-13]|uniref:Mitochondrial import inner membrane translocase subunit TIM50 n=1 Tax=Cochliobolus carbonum (strain 26-R-13) TaxID=930089 RepID=W6YF98_COCC2|nr:uncharacterized protein COCCADRAFT_88607 [Bipolaris zeicola 26-R-13]EUC36303.1 hypothetical protein COCCADRAFT_88607 [Bipolaris zeicola 26-R-13]
MNDSWNPNALPFQPGGFGHREQDLGAFENQLPPPPPPHAPQGPPGPYGSPGVPWNNNFPMPPPLMPPPVPPHMFNNPQAYGDYGAHLHAQAYHQWMMHNGHGYHAPPPPPPPPLNYPPVPDALAGRPPPHMQQHGPPPFGQPPPFGPPFHHGPPPFMHHQQRQMFGNRTQHHAMHTQANLPQGARNEDIQAPNYPGKKSKPVNAVNGHAKQKDVSKGPKQIPATEKKGRYGDEKIMLPAPQPTEEYMEQSAGEPCENENPGPMLVILDLNGTVLYRPNRNAKTMIERPFLKPFLRYLFENFKVMVWSSARPDNVKALVNQALDNDLRSKLVAQWARDSFGLSPANYQQNVQVYKNLKLVWSRSQIQSYHPDYDAGGRFGQHNTVLIDDSSIKASAQPYNLLEIPEFSATPEQMQGDVLREVAGYLEVLRKQSDVSEYIRKNPFVEGGQWTFEWPDSIAGGGEMTAKASAPTLSKKKKKKLAQAAAAAAAKANVPVSQAPLSDATDTVASVPLVASVQRDW